MDDIRDRFRAGGRSAPVPNAYGRPSRPTPAPTVIPPMPKSVPTPVRQQSPPAKLPPVPPKPPKNRKKAPKKLFIFVILLIVVAILSAAGYTMYKKYIQKPVSKPAPAEAASVAPKAEQPTLTGTIRFVATGGNLASDSINTAAKKPDGSYDYLPLLADFKPFFAKSDIRLCNQTTPGGGDKNGLALSGYPNFNAPLQWSTGFAALGCNLTSLASDHINDKGQPAIDATLASWDEQKEVLAVAGANRSADEQAKIRYFTVKQTKFAFLAYTTNTANKQISGFGVNIYSDDLANKQAAEARKNAQLVIVSMNWGTENNGEITAEQDRIAANLAAANVDVIVGVGPHVLQPAKILEGKEGHQTLAWFSLGNFLNSELSTDNLFGGMAIMDFDVATRKLKDPKLIPTYMHYEWTAAQKAAGTVNARNNFKLMPLDVAPPFLAKSQNNTTVEAQTSKVAATITKFAPIKVIKSTEF